MTCLHYRQGSYKSTVLVQDSWKVVAEEVLSGTKLKHSKIRISQSCNRHLRCLWHCVNKKRETSVKGNANYRSPIFMFNFKHAKDSALVRIVSQNIDNIYFLQHFSSTISSLLDMCNSRPPFDSFTHNYSFIRVPWTRACGRQLTATGLASENKIHVELNVACPWAQGQVAQCGEEFFHLLLQETVTVLSIFPCPFRVPEFDLQHSLLLLLLLHLLF